MCQPFCKKTKISIRNFILISLLEPFNQLPIPQTIGDLLLSLLHGFPVLLLPSSSAFFFLSNHLFYTANSFLSICSPFDDPCPHPVCSFLQYPHLPPSLYIHCPPCLSE